MQTSSPDVRSEWVKVAGAELPLDAEAVFPKVTGFFTRRKNAKRAKLLASLRPVLLAAMGPGERIRFVTRGYQYQVWEFVFSGYAVAAHTNQMALVVTTERVLLVHIKSSGAPRDIKNQLRLAAITRAKQSLIGSTFEVHAKDGTKLSFMGLPREDRKALLAALPQAPKGVKEPKLATAALEHLCPNCLQVVPGRAGDLLVCPNTACRIPFRDPKRAAKLSFLVPGIGDLYLRHYFFGAMEFVGSIIGLGVALFFALVALSSTDVEAKIAAGIMALLLVVAPHVIDYFLTLHMGRKGLVPLALKPTGAAAAALLPAFPRWTYALFGAAAIGLLTGVPAALPVAQSMGATQNAVAAAERGDLDAAWAHWHKAGPRRSLASEDAAKLALALYRAGDLTGGDLVLAELGETRVEPRLAADIEAVVDKARQAGNDYQNGRLLLAEGADKEAWEEIDRALTFYQTIKRPKLPQSRAEVVVELCADLLSPQSAPQAVARARELLPLASEAPRPDRQALEAWLAAFHGKADRARALLREVADVPLETNRRLLVLEAQAKVSPDTATRQAVAQAARQLKDDGDEDLAARIGALVAMGGGN